MKHINFLISALTVGSKVLIMYRVNYTAKNFGFVGWEVYTTSEKTVMLQCIKIACSQMKKQIGEDIETRIIEL